MQKHLRIRMDVDSGKRLQGERVSHPGPHRAFTPRRAGWKALHLAC
jgi:hypothetical protein